MIFYIHFFCTLLIFSYTVGFTEVESPTQVLCRLHKVTSIVALIHRTITFMKATKI